MTEPWSRSTTRMAPKPSDLRTLWPPIRQRKKVRICPVFLDHKSNDFTLEIVGFFLFVGWPHLVLTTILTTMPKTLSGQSQAQIHWIEYLTYSRSILKMICTRFSGYSNASRCSSSALHGEAFVCYLLLRLSSKCSSPLCHQTRYGSSRASTSFLRLGKVVRSFSFIKPPM